eukprot:TRINITY_DN2969_c0_g1_i1.p1 TRINITY_DN2969_c0_g1~~TRINITY_DN2969_c0_g1_i1.p1  ORF type:complete len:249 (+),score=64.22 TRINITY_DN2969_c0_g1_i1:75-821(+)
MLSSAIHTVASKFVGVRFASAAPPSANVLEIFRRAKAVCFDVDSTVCDDEGIDRLAEFAGVGDKVKQLTASAMGGSMKFQDALKVRLDLIQPTTQLLERLLSEKPHQFTPGVQRLVDHLHGRGVHVYLVSGGFRQMINPMAHELGIPQSRVYANNLLFEKDGKFAGFDANEPTSQSGGKAVVVGRLKKDFGYDTVVMVGDGATDLEAKPPADLFLGYGGIVVREIVKQKADHFITDFNAFVDAVENKK